MMILLMMVLLRASDSGCQTPGAPESGLSSHGNPVAVRATGDFAGVVSPHEMEEPSMADASEPHPDYIEDAPMSTAHNGLSIEYRYSTGNHYRLNFTDDYHVGFEFLNQLEQEGAVTPIDGPFLAFRARDIRPGLTQLHWIVKDADIHVSITVDFDEKRMYVAAMMPPNKWEFWDSATIISITEN
jgi:hypothetical protein